MSKVKIVYGNWRITNYRGMAHATTGNGDRKRRFNLNVRADAPQKLLKAKLISFVQSKSADDLRDAAKTVGELYQAYVDAKEREGKSSWKKSSYIWANLAPWFNDLDPADITDSLCQDYAEERAKEGKSADTIWTELTEVQMALAWARKQRVLKEDIAVWRPSRAKPRQRVATPAEVNALLNAVDMDLAPHMMTVLLLAILTGARKTAILELTWDRVDLEFNVIKFRDEDVRAYNPLHKGYQKGRATVPIGPDLREYLVGLQAVARSAFVVEYAGSRVRDCKTAFAKIQRRAGLDDVTLHTLRHTHATWANDAEVPTSIIAQMLGHKNDKITKAVYIKKSVDPLRPVAALVEGQIEVRPRLKIVGGN